MGLRVTGDSEPAHPIVMAGMLQHLIWGMPASLLIGSLAWTLPRMDTTFTGYSTDPD